MKMSRRFLGFETACLEAVHSALPSNAAELFAEQVQSINKIQRLLEWKEIEFYSMRWFKVAWPSSALFTDSDEFVLATLRLHADGVEYPVKVWSVGGHVFSIESDTPLKPLRDGHGPKVETVRVNADIEQLCA